MIMAKIYQPAIYTDNGIQIKSKSVYDLKIHAATNEIRKFSDLRTKNKVQYKQENHMLSVATENYQRQLRNRHNQSLQNLKNRQKMGRKTALDSHQNDPESYDILPIFNIKAEKIPYLNQQANQNFQEKIQLTKRMQQLKRLINQQKKKKDQAHLSTCSMINMDQQLKAKLKKIKDTNRNNRQNIQEQFITCNSLNQEIQDILRENRKVESKIQMEMNNLLKLSKIVHENKKILNMEQSQLGQMKFRQSFARKAKNNDYMLMNKRKEEKAQLMANIHLDVVRYG